MAKSRFQSQIQMFRIFLYSTLLLLSSLSLKAQNQLLRARYALETGNFRYRLQLCDSALELDATQEQFRYLKAKAYYAAGVPDSACTLFETLITSRMPSVNYELAQCYALQERDAEALTYLEKHLKESTPRLAREVNNDPAFVALQNTKEWAVFWESNRYSKYENLLNDAYYAYKYHNTAEAEELLDAIFSKRQGMHQAYILKAEMEAAQGFYKNAVYYTQLAVKAKERIADYHYLLAYYLYKNNKQKKALSEINEAIRLDAAQYNYYLTRSNILIQLGENEEALNNLELLQNCCSNDSVLALSAQVHYNLGNYLNCLTLINQCLAHKPAHTGYHKLRAQAYFKTHMYAFAAKDYRFLLQTDGQNGELYHYIALCAHEQGNSREACANWQKAQDLGYQKAFDLLIQFCR